MAADVTREMAAIDRSSPIDNLFDAIITKQDDGVEKMRSILSQNPDLCNEGSNPATTYGDISAQSLLQDKKYGYLSSRDVLLHLQSPETKVDTKSSQRPLHVACLVGNFEAAEVLLEQQSIDPNATNESGETPLAIACRAAHFSIAALLLEQPCREAGEKLDIILDQPDSLGNTPLQYLARDGIYPVWLAEPTDDELEDLAKIMIQNSKQDYVTAPNEFERSCMATASELGSLWLLKAILDLAPETKDLEDDGGWLPLHCAIARGDIEAAKLLLDAGANAQLIAPAAGRLNALQFALEMWELEIAKMIGSKPSSSRERGLPVKVKGWMLSGRIKLRDENESSIQDLIQNMRSEEKELKPRLGSNTMWCHLPANNVSAYPKIQLV